MLLFTEDLLCQQYFDENFFNYHFDFDENFFGLLKEFRHFLSLFSVSLHFLTCIKSCGNKWNIPAYCKLCSRVSDQTFVPCNCYANLLISFDSPVLDLTSGYRIDLDVFYLMLMQTLDVTLRILANVFFFFFNCLNTQQIFLVLFQAY